MTDNTETTQEPTASGEGQAERNPTQSELEQVNSFFDSDWSKDPDLTGNSEPTAEPETPSGTEGEEEETEGEETETEDAYATDEDEDEEPETPSVPPQFQELLDVKIKRHDEVKTVAEWLEENPDLSTEMLGQVFDYATSKREVKEFLAKEKQEVDEAKQGLDLLVLQNLAFEAELPFKTLEDYEADTRIEDPAEAFKKDRQQLQQYIQTVNENRQYAQMENKKMIDAFQQKYPDVDVAKLISEDIQPYLNPTVSKMQLPFPKDALEVYYKGKYFDTVLQKEVKKAVEAERRKIYAELKGGNGTTAGTAGVTTTKKATTRNPLSEARNPAEKSFLEAFNF